MKQLLILTLVILFLLFITFTINERDFLELSTESSMGFDEQKVLLPSLPPYPVAATGLAIEQNSDWVINSNEQLSTYKISSAALYVEVVNDFVYSKIYVYRDNDFESISLEGEKINTNWLREKGAVYIDVTRFEPGQHYIIAYSCRKSGSDFECNDEKWLLSSFETNSKGLLSEPYAKIELNTKLPPPPPPVGELN